MLNILVPFSYFLVIVLLFTYIKHGKYETLNFYEVFV